MFTLDPVAERTADLGLFAALVAREERGEPYHLVVVYRTYRNYNHPRVFWTEKIEIFAARHGGSD
jgi:hypothetical protein